MSRRKIAREVTRESENPNMPSLSVIVTQKTALVYQSLEEAGNRGITCRDWHGYDLRHFIRVLRNMGIGIEREWEPNDPAFGGQHGRWKLTSGHTSRKIAYPEKRKPGCNRASNSNSNLELGAMNNG